MNPRLSKTSALLFAAVALALVPLWPAPAMAQSEAELRRVEASVDAGLAYLASKQQPNGSFPSGYGDNQAVNAVCLLAFLGRGHVPGRGPYREVVGSALEHILDSQADSGLFVSENQSHGPMYEHALATLAVIEASGFVTEPRVRRAAQRAVDLIVSAQNKQGGWRYQPETNEADSSVSAMQIVTLRAAENAQLLVPQDTLDRALQYLRSCEADGGGFGYMPGQGAAPARSAAGLLCYFLLGTHDDPHVQRTLDYFKKPENFQRITKHLGYTSYYAMQAHFQAGGAHWARWAPHATWLVMQYQQPDGAFREFGHSRPNGDDHCYGTAMALLTLEVYMHYLPAYQR